MSQRKKINSSRVNLTISLVFHIVAIGALFFFAGREGMLGKRLKEITVSIAPKEKKPEPAKPKAAEPKPEREAEVQEAQVQPRGTRDLDGFIHRERIARPAGGCPAGSALPGA